MLIDTSLDFEALDVILVLRDQVTLALNSSEIVGELSRTLEKLKETNERLENLQVIEIDPKGSIYHQLFAYKRSRLIIGGDKNLLANSAWMSPRATIINISTPPVQQTSSAILAAMLKLDYKALPTSNSNQNDKQEEELKAAAASALSAVLNK